MSSETTVTEQQAREREREAFGAGALWSGSSLVANESAGEYIAEEALRRYPDPPPPPDVQQGPSGDWYRIETSGVRDLTLVRRYASEQAARESHDPMSGIVPRDEATVMALLARHAERSGR